MPCGAAVISCVEAGIAASEATDKAREPAREPANELALELPRELARDSRGMNATENDDVARSTAHT